MRTLLDRLGVSAKYKGYRMLLNAIEIALENETAVSNITSCIYPRIAAEYGVTEANVEKNIRMAIRTFWEYGDHELYDQVSGFPTEERPGNAAFIGAIASYLIRTDAVSTPDEAEMQGLDPPNRDQTQEKPSADS